MIGLNEGSFFKVICLAYRDQSYDLDSTAGVCGNSVDCHLIVRVLVFRIRCICRLKSRCVDIVKVPGELDILEENALKVEQRPDYLVFSPTLRVCLLFLF